MVLELGEPLLFKAVAWLTFGAVPDGYTISMHPVAFAAWFGLIATALNLFPIAQLDGGHISYAVLGRRSTTVTFVTTACLLAMTALSLSWLAWTVLMIGMLLAFGPQHPRTDRRGDPAGSRQQVAGRVCGGDVRALFHAGANRAARPGRSAVTDRTLTGSTSIVIRRRTSGIPVSDRDQRGAHRRSLRALQEELNAVLAAQAGERGRCGTEHQESSVRRPGPSDVPPARWRWPSRRQGCAHAPTR